MQTGSQGRANKVRQRLVRQPLPQVGAAFAVIRDPALPSRTAQYIRINHFSSDATQQVMKARRARVLSFHVGGSISPL